MEDVILSVANVDLMTAVLALEDIARSVWFLGFSMVGLAIVLALRGIRN